MNLLIDANISYRIVKILAPDFNNVIHVTRTGLYIPAMDDEIWKWAKENNFIIITNDEDFVRILELNGFPPKIVLLRTGNQTTKNLSILLHNHKNEIENLYHSKEYGLLEIF